MIRIGLMGAGFMGNTHAACYEVLRGKVNFTVVAVADVLLERAKKIAGKFGAEVYCSGEEMLAKADITLADICLPTYLHTSHALKAMFKGLDVFVEKPVCLTAEEAVVLLDTRNKTGVSAAAGQCIRFWDEYVYLMKVTNEGTYGRLNSASFKRLSPRPDWGWQDWLLNGTRSGSAALDLHIHDVDFVRYLLGEPRDIKCSISYVNGEKEHIHSIFQYNGAVVSLEGGWDYPAGFPFEMAYSANFEEACVAFSSARSPSLVVYPCNGVPFMPELPREFSTEDNSLGGNLSSLGGYYSELKYFLECIEKGRPVEIAPLEEGVASFLLASKEIEAGSREISHEAGIIR